MSSASRHELKDRNKVLESVTLNIGRYEVYCKLHCNGSPSQEEEPYPDTFSGLFGAIML
jgi:hypothetical protein